MKQVYLPANVPEAHMLVHLLDQSAIKAYIHGEALQLAGGELPVAGTLQILAADEDYDEARRILLAWEKTDAAPGEEAAKRRFPSAAIALLIIGMAGGWLAKSAFEISHFSVGDHTRQEDRNGDGHPDSTWFYAPGSGHAYKGEFDHNHDGRVDTRTFYDATGTPTEQDQDEDFNATFETKYFYRDGVVVRAEIDADHDNVADYKEIYIDGVLSWAETIDPATGVVVRVDNYTDHRLANAELDLDRDGFRETRRVFDRFGEIVRIERIAR